MSYKPLQEKARRTLLALLLRYAEHAGESRLERAARVLIDSLL